MVQDWVTWVLLSFGTAVGIFGVLAYLRLFRKEKRSAELHSRTDVTPLISNSDELHEPIPGIAKSFKDEQPRD